MRENIEKPTNLINSASTKETEIRQKKFELIKLVSKENCANDCPNEQIIQIIQKWLEQDPAIVLNMRFASGANILLYLLRQGKPRTVKALLKIKELHPLLLEVDERRLSVLHEGAITKPTCECEAAKFSNSIEKGKNPEEQKKSSDVKSKSHIKRKKLPEQTKAITYDRKGCKKEHYNYKQYNDLMKQFLEIAPALFDFQSTAGDTALHRAAKRSNIWAVEFLSGYEACSAPPADALPAKLLINKEYKIPGDYLPQDVGEKFGLPSLNLISKKKGGDLVRLLSTNKQLLQKFRYPDNRTILHTLVKQASYDAVKNLLNENEMQILAQEVDSKGNTILHYLALSAEDNTEFMKFVLEKVPQIINVKNADGNTALMLAAKRKREWAIRCLSADSRVYTRCLNNAWHSAQDFLVKNNALRELVKFHSIDEILSQLDSAELDEEKENIYRELLLLFKQEPLLFDMRFEKMRTILHHLIINRHDNIVIKLLDFDKFKELGQITDRDGNTILHYAAVRISNSQALIAKIMVAVPSIHTTPNKRGKTPLIKAAERESKRPSIATDGLALVFPGWALACLLTSSQIKETVLIHDNEGNSAADYLTETNRKIFNLPSLKLLLGTKLIEVQVRQLAFLFANHKEQFINARLPNGNTLLHFLAEKERDEFIFELLKDDSIQKLALEQNKAGDTMFHLLVSRKTSCDLDTIISKQPALLSIQNNDGNTALHLAAILGRRWAVIRLYSNFPSCRPILNNKGQTFLNLLPNTLTDLKRQWAVFDLTDANKLKDWRRLQVVEQVSKTLILEFPLWLKDRPKKSPKLAGNSIKTDKLHALLASSSDTTSLSASSTPRSTIFSGSFATLSTEISQRTVFESDSKQTNAEECSQELLFGKDKYQLIEALVDQLMASTQDEDKFQQLIEQVFWVALQYDWSFNGKLKNWIFSSLVGRKVIYDILKKLHAELKVQYNVLQSANLSDLTGFACFLFQNLFVLDVIEEKKTLPGDYELVIMTKDTKLEKGKIYLNETEEESIEKEIIDEQKVKVKVKRIACSMITPQGQEVRGVVTKINTPAWPADTPEIKRQNESSFNLENLSPVKSAIIESMVKKGYANKNDSLIELLWNITNLIEVKAGSEHFQNLFQVAMGLVGSKYVLAEVFKQLNFLYSPPADSLYPQFTRQQKIIVNYLVGCILYWHSVFKLQVNKDAQQELDKFLQLNCSSAGFGEQLGDAVNQYIIKMHKRNSVFHYQVIHKNLRLFQQWYNSPKFIKESFEDLVDRALKEKKKKRDESITRIADALRALSAEFYGQTLQLPELCWDTSKKENHSKAPNVILYTHFFNKLSTFLCTKLFAQRPENISNFLRFMLELAQKLCSSKGDNYLDFHFLLSVMSVFQRHSVARLESYSAELSDEARLYRAEFEKMTGIKMRQWLREIKKAYPSVLQPLNLLGVSFVQASEQEGINKLSTLANLFITLLNLQYSIEVPFQETDVKRFLKKIKIKSDDDFDFLSRQLCPPQGEEQSAEQQFIDALKSIEFNLKHSKIVSNHLIPGYKGNHPECSADEFFNQLFNWFSEQWSHYQLNVKGEIKSIAKNDEVAEDAEEQKIASFEQQRKEISRLLQAIVDEAINIFNNPKNKKDVVEKRNPVYYMRLVEKYIPINLSPRKELNSLRSMPKQECFAFFKSGEVKIDDTTRKVTFKEGESTVKEDEDRVSSVWHIGTPPT